MQRKHILVAEDEFNTRFSIDAALSRAGYAVTLAEDGQKALNLLREKQISSKPFDLLLMDIQMPGLTGFELMDRMKIFNISVPVLAITGYGNKETVVELMRYGCTEYLDKPFAPDDLLKSIERVLQRCSGKTEIPDSIKNKLREAERLGAIGQLASKLAHEINNPSQVALGYTQLLLDDRELGAHHRSMLCTIEDAILHIAKLNRDLLDLVHPSPSVMSLFKPEIPLEKAVSFLTATGLIKKHTIDRNYQENIPLVEGDQMQIYQMFLNLVVNAVHAMQDSADKKLFLAVRHDSGNGHVFISITDTGCGIPEENLYRIFEPFFTTRGKSGGTGLGLPVVKNIIESHGGTISVTSRVGKGTTFILSLPEAEECRPCTPTAQISTTNND